MNIPVPPLRMQHLEKDRRGYPIPVTVYRDGSGRPHFTINEEAKRQLIIAKDLCPICGEKLLRGRWFVGGPQSAFHPSGVYIDPPMHGECARYALQVCPYLAAPSFTKRIDDKTLSEKDAGTMMLVDPTVIPERPDYFVAVMATAVHKIGDNQVRYLKPVRPYSNVEFWKDGKQIGPCGPCKRFFKEFVCSAMTHMECDCPKCQGYCECET